MFYDSLTKRCDELQLFYPTGRRLAHPTIPHPPITPPGPPLPPTPTYRSFSSGASPLMIYHDLEDVLHILKKHFQPTSAITSPGCLLCRSASMLALSGRLRTIQKAVLHEACHSGPAGWARRRAGRARGRCHVGTEDAHVRASRPPYSSCTGCCGIQALVTIFSRKIT